MLSFIKSCILKIENIKNHISKPGWNLKEENQHPSAASNCKKTLYRLLKDTLKWFIIQLT